MKFRVLPRNTKAPETGNDTAYLQIDHWNDHSFITMFYLSLHDADGDLHEIGNIKIGFKGQTTETSTHTKLPGIFVDMGEEFFSLGQGVEFYKNIAALPESLGKKILSSLRDIVEKPAIIEAITEEEVFSTSLLRDTSLSVVKGQYARLLEGQAELTDFKFKFVRPKAPKFGSIGLSFEVKVDSTPRSNIHAIIGRNGVGKTTILNDMIDAITNREGSNAKFTDTGSGQETEISNDYFSSLVSVSFSAFDPFTPPQEQPYPAKGTCYFYIGLKDAINGELHRTINDLQNDCIKALINCFQESNKTHRWLHAIEKLGSDENFSLMSLERLNSTYIDIRKNFINIEQSDSASFMDRYREAVAPILSRMSSGHAIVLLTITRLIATVEEKTLVLLDEPESHLHPPLLSAFVRALSDLLYDRNGLAVIATHSPVVLQEIPSSCAWKIYRKGESVTSSRPTIETFAENVGVLTSEIFNLEVERSGFHEILDKSAQSGRAYEEILAEYDNQIGFEGRAILKVLIAKRDRGSNHDAS
ncbi:MAG: AAA family ATPase [Porticoccaceae bacterium]|nr:AAA family ATPase [Porticoccaceae bacterium]